MDSFSDIIKDEIDKFCFRINHSDADVFVIMARKAVCFFRALQEHDFLSKEFPNKIILSDRVFDLNNLTFHGKRIAIIDDVIISGSSIAKTIIKLSQSGVREEDIEIIVLAVNQDTYNETFFDNRAHGFSILKKDSYAKLSHSDCLQLCVCISHSLASLGVPYDIDFPNYQDITLSSEKFDLLLDPFYMDSYAVTNRNHEKSDIEVYTLIPKETFYTSIFGGKATEVKNLLHCKLRLFMYDRNGSYIVKMVPMVLFKEISDIYLDEVFESLCSHLKLRKPLHDLFISPSAKFRLLQFHFAHRFATQYFSKCAMNIPQIVDCSMEVIFGYDALESIYTLLNSPIPLEALPIHLDKHKPNLLGYKPIEKYTMDYDTNKALMNPFSYWFEKEEKKARRLLKNKRANYQRFKNMTKLNRLDKGFSFDALCSLIKRNTIYKTTNLVSIFLDRAIDFGMIVPIVYNNKGVLSRAYRHGEDYQYTENDRTKMLYFYKEIFHHIDSHKMSTIQFFKTVALFMQMGEKVSLFNKFLGFKNGSRLLTVQSCIHGAVPTIIDEDIHDEDIHTYIVGNDYLTWLIQESSETGSLITKTSSNQQKGTIIEAGPIITELGITVKEDTNIETVPVLLNEGFFINANFSSVTNEEVIQIEKIAQLLSKWINYSNQKNKRDDLVQYLTALTACADSDTFASSIMEELRIAILDWTNTVRVLITDGNADHRVEFTQNFRTNVEKNRAYTAINSGRKKCKWFYGIKTPKDIKEGNEIVSITDIINHVGKIMKEQDGTFALLAWKEFWTKLLTVQRSNDPLKVELEDLTSGVYLYNIAYRIIEYVLLNTFVPFQNDSKKANVNIRLKKCEEEINELYSEYSLYHFSTPALAAIRNFSYQEINIFGLEKFLAMINKYMMNKCNVFSANIKIYEKYLSVKQKKFIRLYENCIVLDVNSQDIRLFTEYCEYSKNEIMKFIRLNNVKILPLEMNTKYQRLLVVYNDEHPIDISFKILEILSSKAKQLNIQIRSTLLYRLPAYLEFQYNVMGENQMGIDIFYHRVLGPIEKAVKMTTFYEALIFGSENVDWLNEKRGYIDSIYPSFNYYKPREIVLRSKEEEEHKLLVKVLCKKTITIGVITILSCELNAVKEIFDMERIYDLDDNLQRPYYQSNLETERYNYRIVMIQQLVPGNTAAVEAFETLKAHFKPEYYVLIGIAGSLNKKKARVGDVIIADAVIDCQKASEETEGIKYQTKIFDTSTQARIFINEFMVEYEDKDITSSAGSPRDTFRCLFDPICNNGHVIKDIRSEFRDYAKIVDRKVIAVETESAGASYAFYCTYQAAKGLFIIRGISDAADITKPSNNKWHRCASNNAAIVLKELLNYIC